LNAVDNLNNTEFKGKVIWVGRAQKKQERESELKMKYEQYKNSKYQGVNLYVKNLDDDIDDDKLRNVFAPFGTVSSCKVMLDQKNNSRGFGFVCFNTPEEATKSVQELHGKIVGTKPLYVAIAQRKDMRKQQLEQQFAHRSKLVPMRNNIPPMYAPNVFYPGFGYPQQMIPQRGGRFQPTYPPMVMMNPTGRGGKPMRGVPLPQQQQQPLPQQQQQQGQVRRKAPQSDVPQTPDEQKHALGEKLFVLIGKYEPNLSGKLTGMILDSCDIEEINQLLTDGEALKQKINEGLQALKS